MLQHNRAATLVRQAYPRPELSGSISSLLRTVETWLGRRRQRRSLLELSDHMLKDIGITRCEAVQEGDKPFWRR